MNLETMLFEIIDITEKNNFYSDIDIEVDETSLKISLKRRDTHAKQ